LIDDAVFSANVLNRFDYTIAAN